jgi:dihydroneopterin aldolase
LRPAGESDDLELTINYARVFELVESVVRGAPRLLIESVAETIATAVLDQFPVAACTVRVKKHQAPIPGHFTWTAVEIRRTRG